MRQAILLSILCIFLITGCVPSLTQYKNIVDAINNRPVLTGYSRDYILNEFGPPESVSISKSGDRHTEIWTYKTNFSRTYLVVNIKPVKTRYMKITIVGDVVLDANYEQAP